jgi:hypothetical protein
VGFDGRTVIAAQRAPKQQGHQQAQQHHRAVAQRTATHASVPIAS